MTILDYCISLKTNKNFWVVLGVVDMRQPLLNIKMKNLIFPRVLKYVPYTTRYLCTKFL